MNLKTGAEGWVVPLDAAFTPLISHDAAVGYVLTLKDKALRALRVDDGKVKNPPTHPPTHPLLTLKDKALPALSVDDGKVSISSQ